jgi:ring-1,2-phenylacetyl-CoA epoxidase subunit PaaC
MDLKTAHFDYVLRLGDAALLLGQRLGEWCGHGPILEQDIALSNIGLDLIGQARSLLTHAGNLEGKNRSEDDLAMFRDAAQFRHPNLVEQPNGDWAVTIARQFLVDAADFYTYEWLAAHSNDENLRAIAEKSLKEITYHLRWSSEWVIRLGDGTDFSKQKIQTAFDEMWMFVGELFEKNKTDQLVEDFGIGPNLLEIKELWSQKVDAIFTEATLTRPTNNWSNFYKGKNGQHSEHLGFILADLQFMQRTYPRNVW